MLLRDRLLGGAVGAEMVTVVNGLIEKHAGVQGIIAQLEQQGLGGTALPWVATGPNQPITADQVHQVFGSDTVKQLAAKVGLSPQDLARAAALRLLAGRYRRAAAYQGERDARPEFDRVAEHIDMLATGAHDAIRLHFASVFDLARE